MKLLETLRLWKSHQVPNGRRLEFRWASENLVLDSTHGLTRLTNGRSGGDLSLWLMTLIQKRQMELERERAPTQVRDRERHQELQVLRKKNHELALQTKKLEEKVRSLEKVVRRRCCWSGFARCLIGRPLLKNTRRRPWMARPVVVALTRAYPSVGRR